MHGGPQGEGGEAEDKEEPGGGAKIQG
jgi:hypothetical protein